MLGPEVLVETNLRSVPLLSRGKVRDLYALDETTLLIVTTDRISAYDVVLPTPIPGKGRVLTALSRFWFAHFADLIPNHLLDAPLEDWLAPQEAALVEGRAMIVRRVKPLPVEAIVRGYLVGSGWKEYQRTGAVCGIRLPKGLRLAEKLPEPIFTPSTKADAGAHDENISFARMQDLIGAELAARVREVSLDIYKQAAAYAEARGILIADTKFEFGLDEEGNLVWIDEALTPDSSRFWPRDAWRPGENPPSFDKQFVRDWLDATGWNRRPPAPELPADVVAQTCVRYEEALQRLTGSAAGGCVVQNLPGHLPKAS